MIGIYSINDTRNGKRYIGSSRNIEKRISCHFARLRLGTHDNIFLQRAFNKDNARFTSSVILECGVEKLVHNEEYYIKHYKTRNCKFGYNLQSPNRCDSQERWNACILLKMSRARSDYLAKNPQIVNEQLERLKKFWKGRPQWEYAPSIKNRKERRFVNRVSGEVFIGSIPELIRKYPDQKLDKAALQRVASGKNRSYKNWIL